MRGVLEPRAKRALLRIPCGEGQSAVTDEKPSRKSSQSVTASADHGSVIPLMMPFALPTTLLVDDAREHRPPGTRCSNVRRG